MASNKDKTKRILCSEWLLSCTTQWKETGGREHGRTGGVRGREAGAEIKKAIVAIEHPTILKRKFWKQENLNLYSGWKTASRLPVNLEIPSIRRRHRSWDSMIHDTCTLTLQCLVSRQVGVGRQRGTKVPEAGDSDPPVPPSPFAKAGMVARANLNFWLDGDRNK